MGKIDCIILQNRNGVYYQLARKRIEETREDFKYKDRQFIIRTEKIFFLTRRWKRHIPVLLYDITKTEPLESSFIHKTTESKTTNTIWGRKMISDLARGTLGKLANMEIFLYLGLGIAMGLFIGVILGLYVLPPIHPIQIVNATSPSVPIIPSP